MELRTLIYRPNPKHKPGQAAGGPPRWFPSSESTCPSDISLAEAQYLLDGSIEGSDRGHPGARARYAIDAQGRFFKGCAEDDGRTWHGYPLSRELVPKQVPARVLRAFVMRELLSEAAYRKLVGSAS